MSGGLDALENIGKKTMEVLTEGDPGEGILLRGGGGGRESSLLFVAAGFQNKRKLLKGEAPSLSAVSGLCHTTVM